MKPSIKKPMSGKSMSGNMGKMPVKAMGKLPTDMPAQARMPFKKGGMAKKGKKC
jgi:hypothetical protein